MGSHHFCDSSISCSQVQQPLSSPLWANPEQPLELLWRKHKHGATTQKPETESEVRGRYTQSERDKDACVCLHHSPIDGRAGHQRAEDRRHERVVELSEQPAGLLHAALEESLGAGVQVALDEQGLNGFSEQVGTAPVPLEDGRKKQGFKFKSERELKILLLQAYVRKAVSVAAQWD